MTDRSEAAWQPHDRFLELHSRWMTLIGEHLQDSRGEVLEYWRIEKADSVIVLPIGSDKFTLSQENCIVLPAPSYRPGVGTVTLDFPGGRVAEGYSPEQAAVAVLQRELKIAAIDSIQLSALNSTGWAVNSSFSNQKLYGFVAHIDTSTQRLALDCVTYSVSASGIQELLQTLTCLQCRAVLLEWWLNCKSDFQPGV